MDVRQEDLYTGKVKDIFYGMDGSGWVMGRMLGKEIIMKKLNIVLVGLGFGGAFVPIYKDHPGVGSIGIFDTDSSVMEEFARAHGIERLYHSFEEILEDEEVDAVHLVTPIPLHAKQTAAVLNAGKHCACTVPMAVSLEEIREITEAVKRSGKNYMMMETTLYTRQFFYAREMLMKGEFGKIQFLRGSHYQDMANWPSYWLGLPPMWYGTHAIAPMRAMAGARICKVHCFGSGTLEEGMEEQYGNPYPVESAIFSFENGLKGEATRTLFETARVYQEGMFVYGSDASFEWGFSDGDNPIITTAVKAADGKRGGTTVVRETVMPNYYSMLPEEIRKHTVGGNYDPLNPQESLISGAAGGHHGSHPHLVHEFVSSILENRKAAIDEVLGANITAAGICAHLSAMQDGAEVVVPVFDEW